MITKIKLKQTGIVAGLGILALGGVAYAQNSTSTNTSTNAFFVSINSSSTIGNGSSGQDVQALQLFLSQKGFFTLPREARYGYFGSITKNALASYQSTLGITGNGNFNAETRDRIRNEILGQTTTPPPSTVVVPNTNTKAASLRTLLNSINREHANLASIALRKGFDGALDFEASVKALDNNSIEIGKSIGSVYGPAAETEFLEIWRSHITFFVNYTVASKTNDQAKKDQAVNDLAGYVNRVSDFLSKANPNLPREAVHQIVTEHVMLLRNTIDEHFAGNYEASYAKQHATDVQIGTQLADTVAGAIVKQFPERF